MLWTSVTSQFGSNDAQLTLKYLCTSQYSTFTVHTSQIHIEECFRIIQLDRLTRCKTIAARQGRISEPVYLNHHLQKSEWTSAFKQVMLYDVKSALPPVMYTRAEDLHMFTCGCRFKATPLETKASVKECLGGNLTMG